MTETFFGNFDLASLSLWLFWIFFAALIVYLQRENMREGYPLEDDDGKPSANPGLFPLPGPKTFRLPNGRGDVTVPDPQGRDGRDFAMARGIASSGFPFEPTGDPMLDGVGPAAWAERRNLPELDGKGHPKIVPMSATENFHVAAGRDPRGLPVLSDDGMIVGHVTDMWIDEPEQLVRFLEYELEAGTGSGKRLVPLTLCRIRSDRVLIRSLLAGHFAAVPQHASPHQVTKLEEEKIAAYYAGGKLYATEARLEPQIG